MKSFTYLAVFFVFVLLPFGASAASVDVKVNKSDGPVAVEANKKVSVSWETQGAAGCELSYPAKNKNLSTKIKVDAKGKKSMSVYLSDSVSNQVVITCILPNGSFLKDSVILERAFKGKVFLSGTTGSSKPKMSITTYCNTEFDFCDRLRESMLYAIEKWGKDFSVQWTYELMTFKSDGGEVRSDMIEAQAAGCASALAGKEYFWKSVETLGFGTYTAPDELYEALELPSSVRKSEFSSCLASLSVKDFDARSRKVLGNGVAGLPYSIATNGKKTRDNITFGVPVAEYDFEKIVNAWGR